MYNLEEGKKKVKTATGDWKRPFLSFIVLLVLVKPFAIIPCKWSLNDHPMSQECVCTLIRAGVNLVLYTPEDYAPLEM